VTDLGAVRPIETSSLVQQVTREIRRSVLAGRLLPGQAFSLSEGQHELHLVMLRAAATAWDLHVLEMLWRAAERYIRMAFGDRDTDPHEHGRRGHVHEELVEVFETGDPVAVEAAVRVHLDDDEHLARHALAPIFR
jgi:DNA-binding GntR family transcriptional regulator